MKLGLIFLFSFLTCLLFVLPSYRAPCSNHGYNIVSPYILIKFFYESDFRTIAQDALSLLN